MNTIATVIFALLWPKDHFHIVDIAIWWSSNKEPGHSIWTGKTFSDLVK